LGLGWVELSVYRPIYFAGVMATGIVALALREEGLVAVSWALAALAAGAYVLLVALHLVARPGRPGSRGDAFVLFAFVAATEVLASLSRWHLASLVLWAVGVVAWVPVVALALATPAAQGDAPNGSWLLAVVATDSLAVVGAPLARRAGSDWGVALAALGCLLALAAYCVIASGIVRRIWRREIGRGDLDGDHWVTMGALAISTLAASRVLAAMTVLGWGHGARDAARVLAIAAWIAALAWLPALIAAEVWRLRRAPRYSAKRWSTVFPLGMLAVASHALALTAGIAAAKPVFHAFTAIGAAAWIAVAAGGAYAGISAGSSSCSLKKETIGRTYSSSRGQRSPCFDRMSSARRVSKRTGWFR
jgi:tellurite resistance protein TehA-like permease